MKRILLSAGLLLFFATNVFSASAGKIEWIRNFDQALAEAKRTSKPIFIDAWADWCVWCHRLDSEVYSEAAFGQFIQKYIPAKIDVEDNGDGTRFAEQFQIDGLPTILVTDSTGALINRIGGFMSAEAMIADIGFIQQLLENEKKNPADTQVVFDLAQEYLSRDMPEQAEVRFRKLIIAPDATPQQKESSTFSVALAQYYSGQEDAALKSLETYRRLYVQGPSDEDALLLLSEIHLERDENVAARKYLREFLLKYPTSGNATRAKHILSLLEVSQ